MKLALVTGASSGIGWCISHQLAAKGYGIIGVSNQDGQLEQLKQSIENQFRLDCITLHLDLSQENSAEEVYAFCQLQNLQPEILVNNAGALMTGDFINKDLGKIKSLIGLHMLTLTSLCYLFARDMKVNGFGYILNVSSISTVMPYPVITIYAATKSFVRFFSKGLRTELAGHGISVTCLIPGATDTPLNDNLDFDIRKAKRLGVMMPPERVAKEAVSGLFGKRAEVIPGFLNKLTLILLPMMPRFVIRSIYHSKLGTKFRK